MNKPQIEAALNRHIEATAHALIHARDDNGSCLLCRALRGEQHLPTCPLWPLIDSRIQFRMDQESPSQVTSIPRVEDKHRSERAA